MKKVLLYWNTIKYLKLKQIIYWIYFKIKKRASKVKSHKIVYSKEITNVHLNFNFFLYHPKSLKDRTFTFLNQSARFNQSIDWDYSEYGALWTYNLNYFDFINQENIDIDDCIYLITDYIKKLYSLKSGMDAYPISLRTINWIKFRIRNKEILVKDRNLDLNLFNAALYYQLYYLKKNLEYHLLGNHLLENGFALLFGAYYFNSRELYKRASKILVNELDEQILSDGGHFEQSPMYHQIILYRMLDSVNLIKNNNLFNKELLDLMILKSKLMLSWLNNITFSSGEIPLFNDSAQGIALGTKQLFRYAEKLGITNKEINKIKLTDSGYRKISKKQYEIIVDIGNVKASYQPGHTHSDTFSFELYLKGRPLIVDTGISTYNNTELRNIQRSTKSHNTVQVADYESNEVWSGFRIAKRAKVVIINDFSNRIYAYHTGYKKVGVLHYREFIFGGKEIRIVDRLETRKKLQGVFNIHFHPDINLKIENNKIFGEQFSIQFNHALSVKQNNFKFAPEFNLTIDSVCISVYFSKVLNTVISFF